MPFEQTRMNEANIDHLFYAGSQQNISQYFGINNSSNTNGLYFNIAQQPINMVTGYQRQHRKQFNFLPAYSMTDTTPTDQYTRLVNTVFNQEGLHEKFSKACEQSCIGGMCLIQPYFDFRDDPLQGAYKNKIWEYNSFIIDPFFREISGEDAQFVICQEFLSKKEAMSRFPEKTDLIKSMTGNINSTNFYFLPENYNMERANLLVATYVWYKTKRIKKKVYSPKLNQVFDIVEKDPNHIEMLLQIIPDLEIVEVEVPSWKQVIVLNDSLIWKGFNPAGSDKFPFIIVPWNYEPYLPNPTMRSRGLMRSMRSANWLMNRRIIINHMISEGTLNTGYKRKLGAVANEDNLKKTNEPFDIIINPEFEMTDVEKNIPSAVPESDMALADQLQSLIFSASGINLENWSAQEDPGASTLTVFMKQAANLMVLQKYFDQWDLAFKHLGELSLEYMINMWDVKKIAMILGEDPSPFFYSKMFAKYQIVVEEGVLTPTQQFQEYKQWIELDAMLGNIIPKDKIAMKAPIQGKKELIEIIAQQQQQQQEMQAHQMDMAMAMENAKLQELYTKAMNNLASARERHGRNESNIGLFEERLSEVQKNQALSVKAKAEAVEKMIEVIAKYGEVEATLAESKVQSYDYQQDLDNLRDKQEAKSMAEGNKFMAQMLAGIGM